MSRVSFQKLSRVVAAIAAGAFIFACGVEDIDRTQPNKVDKSIFTGDWYFRQTVIDVPATTGISFIGEQGETERIRWEIQENFLFAYRAYAFQPGGDGHVRPGTGAYTDNPVAAFAIQSHFDVIRQYNPQTGEQTNVLIEDTLDRPWYERDYMRVNWGTNLIADFQFGAASVQQQPVTFAVPQDDDPARPSKDQAKIGADYIDIVHRITAQPEINQLYTDYFGFNILECWLYTNVHQDCLGSEIRVRSSFMKRVEGEQETDYMPLEYDDVRFQRFGYFRSERYGYNPEYGVVEPASQFYASRFNLWKDAASCHAPDAELPYANCSPDQLRTIVYYLNEDFPAEYKEGALDNGREWNRVFREAVLAGTGWTEEQLGDRPLFTICPNNPVKETDPAECGYNKDENLNPNPQIGDLRYSMYYYVPDAQEFSPLGYGPSAQDPLTGETLSANAFYYGAAGKWIAARTRDIIKLELGLLDEDELAGGFPASQAVARMRGRVSDQRREFAERYNLEGVEAIERLTERLQLREHAMRLNRQIETGEAFLDQRAGKLEQLAQTGLDEMLMTDEMLDVVRSMGAERDDSAGNLSFEGIRDMGKLLSPDFFNYAKTREARLLSPKAGGCILMAEDVFDVGLVGLASLVKRTFYDTTTEPASLKGNYTDEDVYNFIVQRTMMDTQLHEIGHTVGLRHNFSGSTDALNFGPEYWALRGPGSTSPISDPRPRPIYTLTGANLEGYEQALSNGLMDLQDSSVMDYASTYGTNTSLGMYDAAAIKYAYMDVVEVFNSPDIDQEKAKLLRQGELHYTYYPEVISNAATYPERVAAMYDRRHVNWRMTDKRMDQYDDTLVEVPYSFCSDEYREASAVCFTWDSGVDNWERTAKMADDYRHYALLDSFKRERVGFGVDLWAYLSRVYSRKFSYVLFQYKNWVNDELIIRRDRPCLVVEEGQIVDTGDRFSATPCGEAGLLGAIESINLMAEVIQTPDIGCYTRLKDGCYDTVATNENGISSSEITLVDADPSFCDTYVPAQPADENAEGRIALKVDASRPWRHVEDSTSCEGVPSIVDENDSSLVLSETPVDLQWGNARPSITLYDREKYGYYFYWKPTVIGAWLDKWLAIRALGDSYTDFIGVDANSDTRSFLISLNTLFGEEITGLVGSIGTENPDIYGAQFENDGQNVRFVPTVEVYRGTGRNPAKPTIDPDQQYTLRLWAMSQAAYDSQYTDDLEFQETLRIGRGLFNNSEFADSALFSDPTRYVELTDPETGMIYNAIRQDRTLQDGTPVYSAAYEFIRDIKDRYYEGGAEGPGLVPKAGSYDWQLQGDLRILEIMRSTYNAFGHPLVR